VSVTRGNERGTDEAAGVKAFLSFSDTYFANNTAAGAPDATVRINNPGSTNGDLCAMIYVYDSNQEMNECCGCLTTPDGLRTLSRFSMTSTATR
jgi:hypothetical protein